VGRTLNNLSALVISRPPHRSLQFMVALAGAHPGVSVGNLRQLATLPAARTGNLAALVLRRPMSVRFADFISMSIALPARSPQDLGTLAAFVPRRSVADMTLLGSAGPHRDADFLVALARRLPLLAAVDLLALANLPPERRLESVIELGRAATPAITVACCWAWPPSSRMWLWSGC